MEINREFVEQKVRQLFPRVQVEEAIAILDEYAGDDVHPSWNAHREMVQVCALKWSNGSLDALRECVKAAQYDFRDVLVAARESNCYRVRSEPGAQPTAEEMAQALKLDEEEFEVWLRGDV